MDLATQKFVAGEQLELVWQYWLVRTLKSVKINPFTLVKFNHGKFLHGDLFMGGSLYAAQCCYIKIGSADYSHFKDPVFP